ADDRSGNVLSFLRYGTDGSVVSCVTNFSGRIHRGYQLGLPQTGRWREVLNTDALDYAGAGEGNLGLVTAVAVERHGQPASARLTLPALSTVWLTPQENT
ncbi:MAG: alpha amylase C-terminal domain-containing protein, partial [Actinomycetota bacterium]|nr:alpha amylase C-terminal domain-containing protein [Actinomycetota bacterium]